MKSKLASAHWQSLSRGSALALMIAILVVVFGFGVGRLDWDAIDTDELGSVSRMGIFGGVDSPMAVAELVQQQSANHMPLYFVVGAYFAKIAGIGQFQLRLLSLLLGALTLAHALSAGCQLDRPARRHRRHAADGRQRAGIHAAPLHAHVHAAAAADDGASPALLAAGVQGARRAHPLDFLHHQLQRAFLYAQPGGRLVRRGWGYITCFSRGDRGSGGGSCWPGDWASRSSCLISHRYSRASISSRAIPCPIQSCPRPS